MSAVVPPSGACSGPGGKLIVTDMDRIEALQPWKPKDDPLVLIVLGPLVHKVGVHFLGVLMVRVVLVGVYMRALECWKIPYCIGSFEGSFKGTSIGYRAI